MAPSNKTDNNKEDQEKRLRNVVDPMRGLTREDVKEILPLMTREQAQVVKRYVAVLNRLHSGESRKPKKEWLSKYLRDISRLKPSQ